MSDAENVAKLKAAYAAWHESKGHSVQHWLDLMSDNIHVHSVGDETAGLEFAADCCSRNDAVSYFTRLLDTWDMVYWKPETFVAEGRHVAMFGRCAWTSKATGKTAEVTAAHLWTFENGKATELVELFDSARAAAAASP